MSESGSSSSFSVSSRWVICWQDCWPTMFVIGPRYNSTSSYQWSWQSVTSCKWKLKSIFELFVLLYHFQYSILPESTRWLTVNKRYEEAKEIYKLAAELNGKQIPPHLLLIPVACSPAIEQIPLAQTGTCSSSGNREDASAWMSIWHVFKTPCLLKRLLILFCAW